MSKPSPFFSIVTVSYNAEQTIGETLTSVFSQTWTDYEYIIIDGDSQDNTLSILEPYEKQIDHLISEKDCGISDAFNKGIRMSCGKYILLLNADDTFLSTKVLEDIHSRIQEAKDPISIFHTWVEQVHPNGQNVVAKPSSKGAIRWHIPFNHPGCFIPREIYNDLGLYSLDQSICMDYEFFLRCYFKGIIFTELKLATVAYNHGGVSYHHFIKGYREALQLQNQHFGQAWRNTLYFLWLVTPMFLARKTPLHHPINWLRRALSQ